MWFWYALSAALVSGVSVILNKKVLNKGVHSSVVSFSLFFFSTIIALIFLIANQSGILNHQTFFIATGIAAITIAIGKTLQLNIFKQNNLSEIYPLSSFSPLILYILGLFTLNETIKTTATLGLFIMVAGVYLVNYRSDNKDFLHPIKHIFRHKFSLLYLFALFLSSIASISEKIAINNTLNNNIFYLAFWENIFLTSLIGAYVLKTNKNWLIEVKDNLSSLILTGLIFTLIYFLSMSGFKDGPVALFSTIKKLEVLVVLVLSNIFFHERPSKYVYIGAFLMLIAVVLIKL